MAKKVDLIGMRYGKLTVVERTDQREHGYCLWRCHCDCGNETEATEDSLMYRNVRSCRCLKQEIQRQIPDRLHRFDGTCVEFLDKRKYRSDNTSGFRGVFRSKNGRFRVSIGFKNQRFYLGTYQNYEDAVDVRLKAEEQIHHAFVEAYHIWKEQCMSSQEEIPFIFDVEKVDGEFKITTNINMQKFPI